MRSNNAWMRATDSSESLERVELAVTGAKRSDVSLGCSFIAQLKLSCLVVVPARLEAEKARSSCRAFAPRACQQLPRARRNPWRLRSVSRAGGRRLASEQNKT